MHSDACPWALPPTGQPQQKSFHLFLSIYSTLALSIPLILHFHLSLKYSNFFLPFSMWTFSHTHNTDTLVNHLCQFISCHSFQVKKPWVLYWTISIALQFILSHVNDISSFPYTLSFLSTTLLFRQSTPLE